MQAELIVGPKVLADGSLVTQRGDRTAALVTSDAHGRFQEAAIRGTLFSDGITALTSISNATFTSATTGATATPIAGIWNPAGSGKNLVILQVKMIIAVTASTCTGPGGFVWLSSNGNAGLTLGSVPWNRGSGVQAGSVAKGMSGIAATGLTTTLVVRDAAGVCGGPLSNYSQVDTAVGFSPANFAAVDNVDGSIIVVPGMYIGVFCTTTPVAISAVSSILWEEVNV